MNLKSKFLSKFRREETGIFKMLVSEELGLFFPKYLVLEFSDGRELIFKPLEDTPNATEEEATKQKYKEIKEEDFKEEIKLYNESKKVQNNHILRDEMIALESKQGHLMVEEDLLEMSRLPKPSFDFIINSLISAGLVFKPKKGFIERIVNYANPDLHRKSERK